MNILHITYRAKKETESTPNLTMEFTSRMNPGTYIFSLHTPTGCKGNYSILRVPRLKTLTLYYFPFLLKNIIFSLNYVLTKKTNNVMWIKTNIINLFRYSYLQNLIHRKQISLVNIFFGDLGEVFAELKKVAPVKICVSFHGHDVSEVFCKRYRIIRKYCDAYFVLCEFNKNDLINGGFDASKIQVVKTGLDFASMPIHREVIKKRQIVYVGRLTAKKAIFDAIAVFAKIHLKFPDLKMIVIGDGSLLNKARNLGNELHLSEAILFLGHVPPSVVYQKMLESLLFFLPSKIPENGSREGTPCAIIEAQALGLPVVSTYHAGIPEIVIEGRTALLSEEGDIDGLVTSLDLLLSDKKLYESFSRQAKKYALENYPIEKRAKTLLDLYQKI